MDPITKFALATTALSAVIGTGIAFISAWRRGRPRGRSGTASAVGVPLPPFSC